MPEIELRQPPPRGAAGGQRPILALDQAIMDVAKDRALRPVSIADALKATNPDKWSPITTQRVVSRLKALTTRGMVTRIRPEGGPANGPGTSLYRVRRETDQP